MGSCVELVEKGSGLRSSIFAPQKGQLLEGAVSLDGGETHECSLGRYSDVGPREGEHGG